MSNPQIAQGATGQVDLTVPYTSTPCQGETESWQISFDGVTIAYASLPVNENNGWIVSFDYLSPTSGRATVTVPFLALPNTPPADYQIDWHNHCVSNTLYYFTGHFDVVCGCAAIATPSATNKTANGYTLNVKLDVGDCQSPLSGIVWDPAPSSGQGTTNAVYTNRSYGTVYSGSVTATDANGCIASADFSFQLKLEPNPKGCENAI